MKKILLQVLICGLVVFYGFSVNTVFADSLYESNSYPSANGASFNGTIQANSPSFTGIISQVTIYAFKTGTSNDSDEWRIQLYNTTGTLVDCLSDEFTISERGVPLGSGSGDYASALPITFNMTGTQCEQTYANSGGTNMFENTNSLGGSLRYANYDGDIVMSINGGDTVDFTTRIISFSPEDNSTTTSPVNFNLHAYINEDDNTTFRKIRLSLHNIDQNVVLLGNLSPSDIVLFDGNATSSGDFYFSTSTIIGDGNYRLEACIDSEILFGWLINPFSSINNCINHQFVVGEETFIGHISQRIFDETNQFFASKTATSTGALAANCSPLSGVFDIRLCTAFLFTVDGYTLDQTMKDARNGILTRIPWGYFTRVFTIIQASTTESLPAFSTTLQVGTGEDLDNITVAFDFDDMVAGAGSILDSTVDPINGHNTHDVFYIMVQMIIAFGVLLTIVFDVMRLSHNSQNQSPQNTKLR